MEKIWTLIKKFAKEEEGTEVVEWALVAGLVIIAAAAAWGLIGGNVTTILNNLQSKTDAAATSSGT